jgi:prepilin signal peptidase PulO-like enzyme (type II secretory pathway)
VQALLIAGLVVSGWFCGRIANYLSDILPQTPLTFRPVCPRCQGLRPAFPYWLWPSSCQSCGRPAIREWLLQAGMVGSIFWAYFYPAPGWNALLTTLCLAYFWVVVVIDIEHRLVAVPAVIIGIVLGLIAGSARSGLPGALVGGLAGLLFQLLLFGFGILSVRLYTRWKGRKIDEFGHGFGDVLLGGVIGLLLGVPAVFFSMVYTVFLAGLFSLLYLVYLFITRRYNFSSSFPYGPFLVLGALIALYRF